MDIMMFISNRRQKIIITVKTSTYNEDQDDQKSLEPLEGNLCREPHSRFVSPNFHKTSVIARW